MRICPDCKTSTEERLCPRHGTPTLDQEALARSQHDPLIGRVFDGRYEVLRRIGKGGMGSVYRARQLTVGREVALKVLHSELAGDEAAAGRFVREAKVASRLRHPNTIVIHDFGHTVDGLFIVMELLDGESLAARLAREGALPPEVVATIAASVCRSLAEAHEVGIVHRDLKPGNVFLHRVHGGTEVVKVLDFGVAKFVQDERTKATEVFETAKPTILGTIQYMAPEQIDGGPLTGRADLYALGVMLHRMLSGELPFDADNPIATLRLHMDQEPPPLGDHIPEPMRSLVRRLMAKRPADRPGSAGELAELLAEFALGAHAAEPRERPAAAPPASAGPAAPAPDANDPCEDGGGATLLDAAGEDGWASFGDRAGEDVAAELHRASDGLAPHRSEPAAPASQRAVVDAPPIPSRAPGRGRTPLPDEPDSVDRAQPTVAVPPAAARAMLVPQRRRRTGLVVLVLCVALAAGALFVWRERGNIFGKDAGPRVRVDSVPAGAAVVDADSGRALGETPMLLHAGAGRPSRIRLSANGYYEEERAVEYPAGGEARLHVSLRGLPKVTVESSPPGAAVHWDERALDIGETPTTLPEAAFHAAGPVTLRLHLDGYSPRTVKRTREELTSGKPIRVILERLKKGGSSRSGGGGPRVPPAPSAP